MQPYVAKLQSKLT